MKCKRKHRGAGFVAAGWGIILALACSAERLADSLSGWGIVLGGIAVAFVLMRVGDLIHRCGGPPSPLRWGR